MARLALPGVPSVSELAELDVRRVSVGGGFAFAAIGELVTAGRELLEQAHPDSAPLELVTDREGDLGGARVAQRPRRWRTSVRGSRPG